MYYNNKTTFYVRQYGPMILIVLLSVLFIGSGVLIYLNNSALNKAPEENIVASNNLEEVTTTVDQSVKTDKSLLPAELESLDILEKSSKVELIEVNASKQLVLSAKSKKFAVELIGVDFSNTSKEVMNEIYQELLSADLEIAFDKVKNDKKIAYAYIYKDRTLYNEKLLEEGKAILKNEKENISLIDTLKAAQAYAKQTRAGIWESKNNY